MRKLFGVLCISLFLGVVASYADCDVTMTYPTNATTLLSGTETFTWTHTEDAPGECATNVFLNFYFQKNGAGPTLLDGTTADVDSYAMDMSVITGLLGGEGTYTVQITMSGAGATGALTSDSVMTLKIGTRPTLTDVSIESDNADPTVAYDGDTVTLSFTADEAIEDAPDVTVGTSGGSTLTCGAPSDVSAGARTDWEVACTLSGVVASGDVTFSIDFTDDIGLDGDTVSSVTDATSVHVYGYGGGGGNGGASGSSEVVSGTGEEVQSGSTEVSSEDEEVSNEGQEVVQKDESNEDASGSTSNEEENDELIDLEELLDMEEDEMMEEEVEITTFMGFHDKLAELGIVQEAADCDEAQCERTALRQEVLGIALKVGGHSWIDADMFTNHFSDIDYITSGNWVAAVVETALSLGIISDENSEFRPEENVTRAEAFAMLMGASCIAIEDTEADWQDDVYMSASAAGLTVRTQEEFEADSDVIRQDLFVIASRVYDYRIENGGCE